MKLHATPYNPDEPGFYFDSLEEYEEREKASPVEEFEIQFIDGTDEEAAFAAAFPPSQGNLSDWFDAVDRVCGDDSLLLRVLASVEYQGSGHYDLDDLTERTFEDVDVYEGDLGDLAEHFLDEGVIDLSSGNYLDYEQFERDLGYDGWDEVYIEADKLEGTDEEKEEVEDGYYTQTPEFEGSTDNAEDVINGIDDGSLLKGRLSKHAEELIDELAKGDPDTLTRYVDHDKIARDLRYDYHELDVMGSTYCVRFP